MAEAASTRSVRAFQSDQTEAEGRGPTIMTHEHPKDASPPDRGRSPRSDETDPDRRSGSNRPRPKVWDPPSQIRRIWLKINHHERPKVASPGARGGAARAGSRQ